MNKAQRNLHNILKYHHNIILWYFFHSRQVAQVHGLNQFVHIFRNYSIWQLLFQYIALMQHNLANSVWIVEIDAHLNFLLGFCARVADLPVRLWLSSRRFCAVADNVMVLHAMISYHLLCILKWHELIVLDQVTDEIVPFLDSCDSVTLYHMLSRQLG